MLKKMMVVVVAALIAFAGTRVSAAEVAGEVGFDYMGNYIWRGQRLVDKPVVQPWVNLGFGNFTFGTWANMNTKGKSGEFNEIDLSVDYTNSLTDTISYSVGIIRYEFPNTTAEGTAEIYAGLSFDTFLSPSVTLYYDIDEVDGCYLSFGAGHQIELSESVCLDMSASLGWGSSDYNEAYWGEDSSKMQDLTLSLAMPVALGNWTLTPSVNYVSIMSSSLRETNTYDGKSDYVYAGIGLSTSF